MGVHVRLEVFVGSKNQNKNKKQKTITAYTKLLTQRGKKLHRYVNKCTILYNKSNFGGPFPLESLDFFLYFTYILGVFSSRWVSQNLRVSTLHRA